MHLTTYQRRNLERLRDSHRAGGPTWAKNLAAYRNHWMISVSWVAVMWWLVPQGWPLIVGLSIGALSKDISYIRSLRAQWPAMAEVIDWEKVDKLLASDEPK